MILVVAACGRGLDEAAPGTTTTTSTSTTTTTLDVGDTVPDTTIPTGAPLVVWVDPVRAEAVRAAATDFSTTVGVAVEVVELDVDDIGDQVLDALQAGDGPDIFIGRHDWIGSLVPAGVIAPVGLGGRVDEFLDVAGTAFTRAGEVYGVPVSAEAPALLVNTELVNVVPVGFAQIKGSCEDLGEAIDDCLMVDARDPTLLLPFLVGRGGYLLGEGDDGPDLDDVGIASDGSRSGAQFLRDLIRDGVITSGTGAGGALGEFSAGRAPYLLGHLGTARTAALRGVQLGVGALPLTGGDVPVALVPFEGFYLSATSSAPDAAGTFLREFLATPATMQAIYDASGEVPAHAEVAATAAGNDEVVAVYLSSVAGGRPLPAVADLDAVLAALRPAFVGLFGADIDLAAILDAADAAIHDALDPTDA